MVPRTSVRCAEFSGVLEARVDLGNDGEVREHERDVPPYEKWQLGAAGVEVANSLLGEKMGGYGEELGGDDH